MGRMPMLRLCFPLRLHDERGRAVVDQVDLHVRAEATRRDGHARLSARLDKLIEELIGPRRFRGGVERRASALSRLCGDGEVADQQQAAADLGDVAVEML